MSFTTVLLLVGGMLLLTTALVSVVAVVSSKHHVDRMHTGFQEMCAQNGWVYHQGSLTGEMYRIEGSNFLVRARNTRAAGPQRDVGLNTTFRSDRPLGGTLWIGADHQANEIDNLVDEELDLQPKTTGDAEFDQRFMVRAHDISAASISAEARAALLSIPAARKPQVLLHPPGVTVILHGMVGNPADVHALIRVGQSFLRA